MATSWNQGTLHSYDVTATTTDTTVAEPPDRRYVFDFRDKVHELNPIRSPFFAYLGKMGKEPVSSPQFRFLENRAKMEWTAKDFYLAADVNSGSAVTAGSSYDFVVDTGSASIDWLVLGDTFNVTTVYSSVGLSKVLVRIEDTPSIGTSSTSFTGKIIALSASITGYNILSDADPCKGNASAYAEGSGAPDSVSSEIEDGFGYVQDVRTTAELTDHAMATEYRGYKNEWDRIWAEKLDDHAAKLEKMTLFSNKAQINNVLFSDGLVSNILTNGTVNTDASAFTYSSGSPYLRTVTTAELTYDLLLADMEVINHPARGGSSKKLVLASLPIISFFNKIGDGQFVDASIGAQYNPFRVNMKNSTGSFGHQIMVINTVHGSMHLVAEPFFDGAHKSLMLFADMQNVKFCPLSGNGTNLDTYIKTNVQAADETLRKDMIRTVAGLKVTLPETHALYSLEGL
jgi:hypothetical protein